jgi:hypothetical protein
MEFQYKHEKWKVKASDLQHQVPPNSGPTTQGVTFTNESGDEYHGFLPASSDTWTDDVLSSALERAIGDAEKVAVRISTEKSNK